MVELRFKENRKVSLTIIIPKSINQINKEFIEDTLLEGEKIECIENSKYYISNYGRLISLGIDVITNNRHIRNYPKLLNFRRGRDGYLYTNIILNNKRVTIKPHRLVAKYFISNPNNYPCVNHKDENKENNYYNNLEWCTMEYNNSYGTRLERVRKSRGIKIDVYEFSRSGNHIYLSTENSINKCIEQYHVNFRTVYNSLHNIETRWRHPDNKYIFKYAE